MLRVENLRKTFTPPEGAGGEPVIPVVDIERLNLAAGEHVALLGSSGSGKTTLLHLLAGILAPDHGIIEFTLAANSPILLSKLNEAARDRFRGQHIGYIFQTHHLLPGLTALENVLMGMSFTGRKPDRPWATHLLERVGLSHRLAYKPGKMSVGQQQRVAVARALANRPQLVLADEPTGALDSANAAQTLDLILALCKEASAALILVTHDLDIAARLPTQLQLAQLNRRRPHHHRRSKVQMNLFQLIFKQMRQRALSTILTCFSILLGMALATSIMVINYEGKTVFAQTDYGYDLLVGPKSSKLTLVLNTIYHMETSAGNIPYSLYENMVSGQEKTADGKTNQYRGLVRWAVPYAVGDSYQGRRIVGTTPQLFGVDDNGEKLPEARTPQYRSGEHYSFAQGRAFHPQKFEAVIGAEVAKNCNLAVGSTFQATHGVPTADFTPNDTHPEIWKVVGILNETHTANDKVLFIPLTSFYAIFEHEEGLEDAAKIKATAEGATAPTPAASKPNEPEAKAYHLNPDGTIIVDLPQKDWEISAILVQSSAAQPQMKLMQIFRDLPDAVAVNPATEMQSFFDTFLQPSFKLLVVIAFLVTVLGAVSILVSIYNAVFARNREIAIMRALGATKQKILAIVCLEAAMVGALGGILGLIAGHSLAAVGSAYLRAKMGTGIAWWHLWPSELLYLTIVIAISLLAGLVPALKAYQTPVAENLVGS